MNRFFKQIKRFFIQEVPAQMYACETCDKTSCVEKDWENCQYRLRSEKYIQLQQDQTPPKT